MTALYVDVSHYDRDRRGAPLDWAAIALAGLPGVMLARATYGDPGGWHDETRYFAEHQAGARAAGFTARGGYHNLIHSADDAGIARQVDWLRSELDAAGCTFGMLDVERYEKLGPLGLWPTWSDVVRFHVRWAQVDRRPLCTYLAHWVWELLGKPDLRVLPGPLTNANYPMAAPTHPDAMYAQAGGDSGPGWAPYGGRVPDFWQFTSRAPLSGASASTDINAYRGFLDDLIAMLGGGAVAYPKRTIVRSSLLTGRSNGQLPASILVSTPGLAGGVTVRLIEPAARAWRAFTAFAAKNGHILKATSAADSYRTYAIQESTFRARYTTAFLSGRPYKTWAGVRWYQRPNTATAAVPGTCIEGDAIVLTRRGLKAISDVRVGDEVWTHEYRWRPVTHVASFERPVVRVTGSGHAGIDVTREHRWWVFDGWHRALTVRRGISYAGTQLAVRATPDIVGDLWASPDYVDGVDAPEYATPEWLRWAGAWVADGSLHYVNGVLTEGLIYPRHSKTGQIEQWATAAGVALTENADRADGTRRFRFGRAEARRLEEHFGRLSTERTVPVWLLANAQKLAEPFLAGFLHGDGHRTANPTRTEHWSFSTSSRRLAVGLRLAAQAIGWHAYISDRRWTPPTMVKGRLCSPTAETWALTIYETKPPIGTRLWDHQGYVVGRVRRVSDHGETCVVYDLTVAEDESFCVDGIFTHNSNHGWAMAVDVGEERDTDAAAEALDTATLNWMLANEQAYGFMHGVDGEPWHIDYFAGDNIPAAVLAFERGASTGIEDLPMQTFAITDGSQAAGAYVDLLDVRFYALAPNGDKLAEWQRQSPAPIVQVSRADVDGGKVGLPLASLVALVKGGVPSPANPGAPGVPTLVPHVHSLDAPGANTGPAIAG